jgi:1,4-alpha-glucan branching enzyme
MEPSALFSGTLSLYIAIHAHAPLHSGSRRSSDPLENPLHAFVAQSLVPLLHTLLHLEREGVGAPVSIGISPLLCHQLGQLEFPQEYSKYLQGQIEACQAQGRRFATCGQDAYRDLALFWESWHRSAERDWEDTFKGDVLGALRSLQDSGRVELFTSCATEAFLPFLASQESVAAQLRVARESHKRFFGRSPVGLWLPPLAAGEPPLALAHALSREGIEFAICGAPGGAPLSEADAGTSFWRTQSSQLDAMLRACTPSGEIPTSRAPRPAELSGSVVFLHPHPPLCEQAWRREGYAGDERFLAPEWQAGPGDLRLWRNARPSLCARREVYEVGGIGAACEAQAAHWIERAVGWSDGAEGKLCAAFDASLFGADWFEGHNWLQRVLKNAARDERLSLRFAGDCSTVESVTRQTPDEAPDTCHPLTPSDAEGVTHGHDQPVSATPTEPSLWWNSQTEWLWPEAAQCEREFLALAREHAQTDNPKLREVLDQAARELLLLQCGDWPLSLSVGSGAPKQRVSRLRTSDEAAMRFADHGEALRCLLAIARLVSQGKFMTEGQRAYLEQTRAHDDVFPFLSFTQWLQP